MPKKLLAIALSVLLFSLIFTACKKQAANEPNGNSHDDISSLSLTYPEGTSWTSPGTNEEIAVSDPTVWIENCETPDPTGVAVSDPTRCPEKDLNPYGLNYLTGIKEITVFSEGKSKNPSLQQTTEVLKLLNEELNSNWWDMLRLAVTEDDISKLKAENSCIEISFNSLTKITDNCDCIEPCTYEFDKILVVLDGENENTIYFSQNGRYKHGPIRFPHSDLSENLLKIIST